MTDKIVKNLNFGQNAKDKIFEGITKLTKAVSSTLGASGKCVILEDGTGKPVITKDGVTVANSITLLDPVENIGATLIKEAARKTVSEAGDGTTTATVLAHSILEEAYKILGDESPRQIKEGINNATSKVLRYLEKIAIPVEGEMLKQVASISANNDYVLGSKIAEAFIAVGDTGVVMMEESLSTETSVDIIDGVEYEQGLKNFHFVTNQKNKSAELDNPLVLIVENEITSIRKIQSVLEHVIQEGESLLIIADVDPQVLNALAMNKLKGNLKVNVIDAPTFGITRKETLNDLALLTGATVINEDLGDDMDLIDPDLLGSCLKSVSHDTETIIQIDTMPAEVKSLASELKKQYDEELNPNQKHKLEKRLARLSAKVAIVKVGADSEVELKEKFDRAEDAICATKAAIKEGIVPGGGIALLNASTLVTGKSKSENVLLEAIKAPYKTILHNAGLDEVYPPSKNKGLNVVTGKMVNMIKAGIVDPLLVTKSALKNAASVANTIISTDCVINNLRVGDESNR
jgi:chaperonin GroEL